MTKTSASLMAAVIIFLLWGCDRWGIGLPENVVARVDGEQISLEEFTREFKEQTLEPRIGARGSLGDLKRACLDQMIDRKILVEEARRTGIRVTPEELNQAMLDMRKDYSEKDYADRLTSKGST